MTYEERIDSLIPLADKEALEIVNRIGQKSVFVKGMDQQNYAWDHYTFFFHQAMNRLCREKGLR